MWVSLQWNGKITWTDVVSVSSDARNMARDVHNVLVQICQDCGSMSEAQAEEHIKTLSAKGRYSVDVWF